MDTKDNCSNCSGPCRTKIFMPCEVCSLVHGDNTVKLCFYCDVCTAYICCARCKNDLINRAKAAAIKLSNKAKEVFTPKKQNEKAKTTNRRNK